MKILIFFISAICVLTNLYADLYEVKPIFDSNTMCASLSKNFAVGYEYSKKDKTPHEFCRGIVAVNINTSSMPCNIDQIVDECSTYINSQKGTK